MNISKRCICPIAFVHLLNLQGDVTSHVLLTRGPSATAEHSNQNRPGETDNFSAK